MHRKTQALTVLFVNIYNQFSRHLHCAGFCILPPAHGQPSKALFFLYPSATHGRPPMAGPPFILQFSALNKHIYKYPPTQQPDTPNYRRERFQSPTNSSSFDGDLHLSSLRLPFHCGHFRPFRFGHQLHRRRWCWLEGWCQLHRVGSEQNILRRR